MAKKPLVRVTVNGREHQVEIAPRLLLVHFIRDILELTGTHIGCDTSHCGACTVLLNGKTVKSCTVFAVQVDGGEILTVEGLMKDGQLLENMAILARCRGRYGIVHDQVTAHLYVEYLSIAHPTIRPLTSPTLLR